MRARGTFVSVPDEELGEMTVQGPIPRLASTPGRIDHLGRPLGADNAYVYGLLGLGERELQDLRAKHVI
jgi:crotonobetainyl-CoA:carnitine CoA-transferase CaiB-like acyl-CoA transferase